MLKKAYLEIMAAVKEFKDKASFFSLQLDGWTALTGEYIFQAVSSVDGTPFFETQPTPQGSKCDAGWMLKCVKPLVEDPKCAGLTADNCNGMQDLKAAFLELAAKLKRVVFYANCQWHGVDSIGGALIGQGGVATAAHVLAETTGPAAARWTMDANNATSIPVGVKSIVKMVTNRQRLRGYFKKLQAEANVIRLAQWAKDKKEALINNEAPPRKPRPLPMPALNGTTRKLSIVRPLVTVHANREILDVLVRSSHFETYLSDQNGETRAKLTAIADMIKEGVLVRRSGVMAELFGILQLHQRMCEGDNQNLSDGIFHLREMVARIEAFDNPLITAAHKKVVLDAVWFRFKKLWTPNYALAYMLDPRTRFGAAILDLPELCADVRAEAYSCLEKRIAVLPADVQVKIRRHYNQLTAGSVFDFVHTEAHKLEAAYDMRTAEWWATFYKPEGADLSKHLAEPLFTLSLAQAGVERVNSAAKHVVEGRWQLHTENQRMLTAIYVNGRSLKQAHQKQFAEAKPGSFRLGANWPPRSASLTAVALDDVLEEGEIEPSTALRDALSRILNDDEDDAARAPVDDAGAAGGDAGARGARKKRAAAARKKAAQAKRAKPSPRASSAADNSIELSDGSGDDADSADEEEAEEEDE
jgi:hypothetical protein